MDINQVIEELRKSASSDHLNKMNRFGIVNKNALGVKMPDIRRIAKKIGINHQLAVELWKTDVHEAFLLSSMIADEKRLSEKDFDEIVQRFYSWDMCDCMCHFLSKSPFAERKILEYADNKHEFVKRTSFVLMCCIAVHKKDKPNDFFYPFFEIIEKQAWDERNFVRKAVNWALRQIGKRNEHLRIKAIETSERILKQNTKSARWIANDALRELRDEKIMVRMIMGQKIISVG